MGSEVWGLGSGVDGIRYKVSESVFRVPCAGLGSRIQGSGVRVELMRFREEISNLTGDGRSGI